MTVTVLERKEELHVFTDTLSFANPVLASWDMTGFALFIRGFKIQRNENKGIIGTTQVEILIYWTGANTCFSAQSYDFMKV